MFVHPHHLAQSRAKVGRERVNLLSADRYDGVPRPASLENPQHSEKQILTLMVCDGERIQSKTGKRFTDQSPGEILPVASDRTHNIANQNSPKTCYHGIYLLCMQLLTV